MCAQEERAANILADMAMAYTLLTYVVMAYKDMTCIAVAYRGTAYIVMAYMVMAYAPMALAGRAQCKDPVRGGEPADGVLGRQHRCTKGRGGYEYAIQATTR